MHPGVLASVSPHIQFNWASYAANNPIEDYCFGVHDPNKRAPCCCDVWPMPAGFADSVVRRVHLGWVVQVYGLVACSMVTAAGQPPGSWPTQRVPRSPRRSLTPCGCCCSFAADHFPSLFLDKIEATSTREQVCALPRHLPRGFLCSAAAAASQVRNALNEAFIEFDEMLYVHILRAIMGGAEGSKRLPFAGSCANVAVVKGAAVPAQLLLPFLAHAGCPLLRQHTLRRQLWRLACRARDVVCACRHKSLHKLGCRPHVLRPNRVQCCRNRGLACPVLRCKPAACECQGTTRGALTAAAAVMHVCQGVRSAYCACCWLCRRRRARCVLLVASW